MPQDRRGFAILLEDEAILGVVKPSGIATQAPPEIESLESRIKQYLAGDAGDAETVYLGIPHRLDRAASGAMIFAKTRRAARNLSRQFERRQVEKTYWAAVERLVEPLEGVWTDYLCKIYGQPKAQIVAADHPGAQQAILKYRVLGRHRHGAWLEIELETGRTHQVRVQAASRGWPIVGDAHYGSRIPFGPTIEDERLRPIALHARMLRLRHPLTQATITLDAEVAPPWDELDVQHFTGSALASSGELGVDLGQGGAT